ATATVRAAATASSPPTLATGAGVAAQQQDGHQRTGVQSQLPHHRESSLKNWGQNAFTRVGSVIVTQSFLCNLFFRFCHNCRIASGERPYSGDRGPDHNEGEAGWWP